MAKTWTAAEIFDEWHDETKDGLDDRTVAQQTVDEFRAALMTKIQERLDAGDDYEEDRKATKTVAKDLGKILKILTRDEQEVPHGLFVAVFKLIKFHPACQAGGSGGGVWCDI